MTQVEDQASQAEERSQETRSFMRQVRAATRRKYTPEEKIRIVLEGFRRETTVNDLCRREGIKPHSYYAWTKGFMEAGKERLTRDSVRDATRQEIEQLKRENSELKQLVGELSLELHRFKKTAAAPTRQRHRRMSVVEQSKVVAEWNDMVEGRTGDSGSLAFPGARIMVEVEAPAG